MEVGSDLELPVGERSAERCWRWRVRCALRVESRPGPGARSRHGVPQASETAEGVRDGRLTANLVVRERGRPILAVHRGDHVALRVVKDLNAFAERRGGDFQVAVSAIVEGP